MGDRVGRQLQEVRWRTTVSRQTGERDSGSSNGGRWRRDGDDNDNDNEDDSEMTGEAEESRV